MEVAEELVVSGCDASELLEAGEHLLDAVALLCRPASRKDEVGRVRVLVGSRPWGRAGRRVSWKWSAS